MEWLINIDSELEKICELVLECGKFIKNADRSALDLCSIIYDSPCSVIARNML